MEIFDLIRDIKDPEHEDLTLEALNVLRLTNVTVDNAKNRFPVFFTPTGMHTQPFRCPYLHAQFKMLVLDGSFAPLTITCTHAHAFAHHHLIHT